MKVRQCLNNGKPIGILISIIGGTVDRGHIAPFVHTILTELMVLSTATSRTERRCFPRCASLQATGTSLLWATSCCASARSSRRYLAIQRCLRLLLARTREASGAINEFDGYLKARRERSTIHSSTDALSRFRSMSGGSDYSRILAEIRFDNLHLKVRYSLKHLGLMKGDTFAKDIEDGNKEGHQCGERSSVTGRYAFDHERITDAHQGAKTFGYKFISLTQFYLVDWFYINH